jgi:integrase
MNTSYDVRVWKIDVYESARGSKYNTYYVRWRVGHVSPFKEPFKTRTLAESFLSGLVAAMSKGEAFDLATGLPVSMVRAESDMGWYEFACAYVDMKWPGAAGNSRKGVAETLATVTPHMLATKRGKPSDKTIRRALNGWAFNLSRRDTVEPSADIAYALVWLKANTRPISVLKEASEVRGVIALAASKLDGKPAAGSVVRRKRAVLFNVLEYAVELKLLDVNPLTTVKWKVPKPVRAIDKRVAVNPNQAARLLLAVLEQEPSGPLLVTFFAVMYYAALRPGEAVNLRKQDLALPKAGWGELLLWESAPETGASWSETGLRRDKRQLKHRERGDTRPVPCPPPLTALLHEHLRRHGTDEGGYLFRGVRGTGLLSESTYSRAWRLARRTALTPDEYESPLAWRAYHLRHACVSTWLNGGVAPTQVAEWAGHSVAVLLQIYAKCLAGQEDMARKRIEDALGLDTTG